MAAWAQQWWAAEAETWAGGGGVGGGGVGGGGAWGLTGDVACGRGAIGAREQLGGGACGARAGGAVPVACALACEVVGVAERLDTFF